MPQIVIRFNNFSPCYYNLIDLLYVDHRNKVRVFENPYNLIADWRARQLLLRVGEDKGFDLDQARQATCRTFRDSEKEVVKSLKAQFLSYITEDAFDEVMKTTVPQAMVKFILDSQGTGYEVPLWILQDEIKAGAVEKCQALEAICTVDAVEDNTEKYTLLTYEELVESFAEHCSYPIEGYEIAEIKRQLAILETRGVANRILNRRMTVRGISPKQIFIALAGIKALVIHYQQNAVGVMGMKSDDVTKHRTEAKIEEAVEQFADWMLDFTPISLPKKIRFRLIGQMSPVYYDIVSLIKQNIGTFYLPD